MASKAVKNSPPDSDKRRGPGGTKKQKRHAEKKGPVTEPSQHPYKPEPSPSAGPGDRSPNPKPGATDQREALFNAGAVGTFRHVMVRNHEVTHLRAILIEIDGECLQIGNVIEKMPADGFELYERHVRGWLDNHALLRKAEVRFSGRWLHCILWFDTPVEIQSDRRRELWGRIVKAVQWSLPSDPEAPRLLAMTRPIGSVNSKTGRKVELIKAGEPVSQTEVLNFADELTRRGFSTVSQILFGSTEVSPCPICRKEDSTLSAISPNRYSPDPAISCRGSCYHCGKVDLTSVINLVAKGREKKAPGTEAGNKVVEAANTKASREEAC
jgi:hypothetical protein